MSYEYTQADYDERKQRQNDGQASDEDRRLIKQYEKAGFIQSRLKTDQAAEPEPERDGQGDAIEAPSQRDDKPSWVAFAVEVNKKLDPESWPVEDPEDPKVTKQELIDGYRQYTED